MPITISILALNILLFSIILTLFIFLFKQKFQQTLELSEFRDAVKLELQENRRQLDGQHLENLKYLQESIKNSLSEIRIYVMDNLKISTEQLTKQVEHLNTQVELRLTMMTENVDKKLNAGFEKTTLTFTQVVERLAMIDEAQKKITELSSHVVSLHEILNDKKARGAFGEVQLEMLIKNMLPEKSFSFQYTLANGKRADCILFLPSPTGNIVVDAKFPLENYRQLQAANIDELTKKQLAQQFRQDIKKHINDIAEKYIAPPETADGAILFLPAESIFAEIHAHYSELIDEAHHKRVWITSPTTMMAILTTARAAIRDADTRKQVHLIQEHLIVLSKDFDRFRKRMENLAKHIQQANEDVREVQTSAHKIANRFGQIEKVELEEKIEDEMLI